MCSTSTYVGRTVGLRYSCGCRRLLSMKNEFCQPPKNYSGRTISTVAVRWPCGLCDYLRETQGRRTVPLHPPCVLRTASVAVCVDHASTMCYARDGSIGVCLYSKLVYSVIYYSYSIFSYIYYSYSIFSYTYWYIPNWYIFISVKKEMVYIPTCYRPSGRTFALGPPAVALRAP